MRIVERIAFAVFFIGIVLTMVAGLLAGKEWFNKQMDDVFSGGRNP